jgi:glycosyltransferase involved in cell wall biosynthesis
VKLSIVIPVYNEEATLREIVRRTLAAQVDAEKEIILVDDGSTDGSREVMKEIEREHGSPPIRVFFHDGNRGKGAAMRTGFSAVTGDIVLIQDADLEYDPRDYPQLLEPILEGRADVVYGSRFVGAQAHRVLLFWHMIGNRVLTLFSNMLTNLNLTDMETGYKVFRSEVIHNISVKSNGFEFEPEITAKIARAGHRVYEVGISYAGRDYAEGKKITWVDGVKAIMAIMRYRFFD